MTSFKYKPNKIKYLDEINTLDSTHKNFAKRFTNDREDIVKKKKNMKKLNKQLKNLDDGGEFNTEVIKKMNTLKKEISKLAEQINDIENDKSEINYYSNAGDFIIDYYDEERNDNQSIETCNIKEKQVIEEEKTHLDKLNSMSKMKRKPKKNTKKRVRNVQVNQKSILDFFEDASQDEDKSKDTKTKEKDKDKTKDKKTTDSSSVDLKKRKNETTESGTVKNKATLYDQYMKIIDPSYNMNNKTRRIAFCKNCEEDMLLLQTDGIYVCTECGEFENVIIESDIPNYKDQLQEKPAYIRVRRTGRYGIARFLIIMN